MPGRLDAFGNSEFDPGYSSVPSLNTYGTAVSAAGDIMQGFGALMEGEESNAAYDYNASILDEQANQVMVAAGLKEQQMTTGEEELLSTQKAMYTKSGVTMSGSPTDVALQSATNAEYDKLVVDYNAKVDRNRLQSQAIQERYYGKMAESKGQFTMGADLLKGGMALGGLALLAM